MHATLKFKKTNFSEIVLAIYLFIYFIYSENNKICPLQKINAPNHYFYFILFYFRDNFFLFFFVLFFLDKKSGIFGFSRLDSNNFAIYIWEFLANIFISQIWRKKKGFTPLSPLKCQYVVLLLLIKKRKKEPFFWGEKWGKMFFSIFPCLFCQKHKVLFTRKWQRSSFYLGFVNWGII